MLTDQAKSMKNINKKLRRKRRLFPSLPKIDVDLYTIGKLAEYNTMGVKS